MSLKSKLTGMMRFLKREEKPVEVPRNLELNKISRLIVLDVCKYIKDSQFSRFSLNDGTALKNVSKYLENNHAEEIKDLPKFFPASMIVSLHHPDNIDTDVEACIPLIIEYISRMAWALENLDNAQIVMGELTKVRDIFIFLTRNQVKFSEIASTINNLNGYLVKVEGVRDTQTQFLHKGLLICTTEYKKMRK